MSLEGETAASMEDVIGGESGGVDVTPNPNRSKRRAVDITPSDTGLEAQTPAFEITRPRVFPVSEWAQKRLSDKAKAERFSNLVSSRIARLENVYKQEVEDYKKRLGDAQTALVTAQEQLALATSGTSESAAKVLRLNGELDAANRALTEVRENSAENLGKLQEKIKELQGVIDSSDDSNKQKLNDFREEVQSLQKAVLEATKIEWPQSLISMPVEELTKMYIDTKDTDGKVWIDIYSLLNSLANDGDTLSRALKEKLAIVAKSGIAIAIGSPNLPNVATMTTFSNQQQQQPRSENVGTAAPSYTFEVPEVVESMTGVASLEDNPFAL